MRSSEQPELVLHASKDDLAHLRETIGREGYVVFVAAAAEGCESLMRFLMGLTARGGDGLRFGFLEATDRRRTTTLAFVTTPRERIGEDALGELGMFLGHKGPADLKGRRNVVVIGEREHEDTIAKLGAALLDDSLVPRHRLN
jgi:hypothetical protein